jgi:hypothetical protein
MPIYPNSVLNELIKLLKLDEEMVKKCYQITVTLTVGDLIKINYETHAADER